MNVDEGDMTRTSKKHKIEEPSKLVLSAKVKGRKKVVKVKDPTFEIQEYTFSSVPKEEVDRYKSKAELLEKLPRKD